MCNVAIHAQCPTGSVIIYTQASVDNFAANYPNCTKISGNLTIGHWTTNAPITDLNGLNQLISIGGDLIIEHDSLTNLTGLENLTTIERDMKVYFTKTLVNLNFGKSGGYRKFDDYWRGFSYWMATR